MSKELKEVLQEGDKWLRSYLGSELGVQTNDVILGMYEQFPFIKQHEYWTPQDSEMRFIKLNVYVATWRLLFIDTSKFMEELEYFIKEYLPHHDIELNVKRYKKGYKKG